MTNPNDPAQPQHGWSSDPSTLERMKNQGGLTKREYFAAMILQGMWANPSFDGRSGFRYEVAVRQANSLIAELNKEPKP